MIDLHLHSTASDGAHAPTEVVRRVAAAGLAAMALTDHDTVAGVAEAVAEGERLGVRVISGCEFSVSAPWGEMHLLGYFLPTDVAEMEDFLIGCRNHRLARAGKMVTALQAWGMDITLAEVVAIAGGGAIGRPHVARVLVQHGTVESLDEAFNLYLGRGRPGYVGKVLPPLAEVATLVHRHGGLVSAAHLRERATRSTLTAFQEQGLDCLEVLHPSHSPDLKPRLAALATRLGLLPTGGSDWHGGAGADHTRSSPGSESVPMDWLDALEARCEDRAGR